MRLNADQLVAIANKLIKLNEVDGVEVNTFRFEGHTVVIQRLNNKTSNTEEYVVKGITDGELQGNITR